ENCSASFLDWSIIALTWSISLSGALVFWAFTGRGRSKARPSNPAGVLSSIWSLRPGRRIVSGRMLRQEPYLSSPATYSLLLGISTGNKEKISFQSRINAEFGDSLDRGRFLKAAERRPELSPGRGCEPWVQEQKNG